MLWPLIISVLTFVVGFGIGFLYFGFAVGRKMRPLSLELIKRMVKMLENEGLFAVLVGRRQMIDAVKHQIEAHGLSHKEDALAWLAKMDKTFVDEQTRESERAGVEARRQVDEEEAQAKGRGE